MRHARGGVESPDRAWGGASARLRGQSRAACPLRASFRPGLPSGRARSSAPLPRRPCAARGDARECVLGIARQPTDDGRRRLGGAEQVEVPPAAHVVRDDGGDASAGSYETNPCASAAMLRAIPPASTTSATGASSHLDTSAVEPSSLVALAPSKSPITPSMMATSALWQARAKVARTASRPIIQPSRFCDGASTARAWYLGSR